MIEPILTGPARRHIRSMAQCIENVAPSLDRRFRRILKARDCHPEQANCLLAITPAAAANQPSLRRFLQEVELHGRRLAKLNMAPAQAGELLAEFNGLLDEELAGRFAPAREQLQLATMYALKDAYYQVREAESQAFFGLYRAEAEAVDVDDLLRRSVRVMVRTFHAGEGRLLLLDSPPEGRLASPLYIEAGTKDEGLIADERMRGRFACYWSYPLRPAAMVQLAFKAKSRWLPRELTMLQALAGRCEEAIENARLEGEIRRLEAEARQGEEEERRRIGRELHDEAGQSLLFLRLQLEMMGRDAPEALRARLAEARELTERTVTELRRIIAALSPAVLERLGLESALRQLAGRFRKMHPAEVRLHLENCPEELPRQQTEVIYRVAQESLQNIAKHTRATFVNLSLHRTDKSIRLRVSDNGAGFSAETAKGKPMSFGLTGMKERAALLNGTLAVKSAPGKGTTVVLDLPTDTARVATNGKDTRPLN